MRKICFALFISLFFWGCQRPNKMALSPAETNDLILKVREETQETSFSNGSHALEKKGAALLKLKEDRRIDTSHPPYSISLFEDRSVKEEFPLSRVASHIQYVRLETPPDTSFSTYRGSKWVLEKNYIIYQGFGEVALYNRKGHFLETICRNQCEKVSSFFGHKKRVGLKFQKGASPRDPCFVRGNNLYYFISDREKKKRQLVCYEIPQGQALPDMEVLRERQSKMGKGEGSFGVPYGGRCRFLFNESGLVARHGKWNSARDGKLMVSYDYDGDTLCAYTDYDRIVNFQSRVYRSGDGGDFYDYKGQPTLRVAFGDTVFRMVAPNRLMPVYVLDLGPEKVRAMEGMSPRFGLKDKYIMDELVEIPGFLFISYTKNYSCPATGRNGSLRYNRCVFDKRKKKLFYLYVDAPAYFHSEGSWPTHPPTVLKNDLDGGFAFWPGKVSPDGRMYRVVTGKELKQQVLDPSFETSKANFSLKANLKALAGQVSDEESLLMMVW